MNFRMSSSSTLIWQSFAVVQRSEIRCQPPVCVMAILPVFRVRASGLLQHVIVSELRKNKIL